MSLKLQNTIVFAMYLLAILRHDVVIGHGISGKVIPAKMARLAESQSLE
jgi:hypothetical protein